MLLDIPKIAKSYKEATKSKLPDGKDNPAGYGDGFTNLLGSAEKTIADLEPHILKYTNAIGLLAYQNLEIIAGIILAVKDHPDPKITKLWVLDLDTENGPMSILCNLRQEMTPVEVINREVLIIVGLEPKTINEVTSSAMLYRFLKPRKETE